MKKDNDMLENSEVLNKQAINLAESGMYNEAVACLRRAVVIDKKNYLLWYNLGITYRDAGNLSDAKLALLQAYKLNDLDEELLETLALVCFGLEDYDEAFGYCYECLDLNPLNFHCWNNLGVMSFSKQDFESAVEAFEMAISINPAYYDALYNLRDAYLEIGNVKGSRECDELLKNLK